MMRLLAPFLLLFCIGVSAREGQDMPAMHHLVKVKPSENISVPKAFPLNDQDEIDCQTCHGIKDMKDQDFEKVDKQAEDFFRDGPYENITDFCYRCHDDKQYQRDNIHDMLDQAGKIIKNNCLYCHEKALDVEKEHQPDELGLRLPAKDICYGCHLNLPHFNALNHQRKPDDDMVEKIRQSEREYKITLPLSSDGKITCVTCHSPHPVGVISRDKPAGRQVDNKDLDKGVSYQEHIWDTVFVKDKQQRLEKLQQHTQRKLSLGYQRIETEILLRLPAKDGTLCLACHEFEK